MGRAHFGGIDGDTNEARVLRVLEDQCDWLTALEIQKETERRGRIVPNVPTSLSGVREGLTGTGRRLEDRRYGRIKLYRLVSDVGKQLEFGMA